MADTSFDSSAPDYPNLQGGNSSATNMKNSVANCKVRTSRNKSSAPWTLPAGYVYGWAGKTLPGLRERHKTRQSLVWASVTVTSQSSALQLSSSSSRTLLAENHPQTSLQTSKLTPDKQYLH
jgi:hypothetical protein